MSLEVNPELDYNFHRVTGQLFQSYGHGQYVKYRLDHKSNTYFVVLMPSTETVLKLARIFSVVSRQPVVLGDCGSIHKIVYFACQHKIDTVFFQTLEEKTEVQPVEALLRGQLVELQPFLFYLTGTLSIVSIPLIVNEFASNFEG